MKPRHWMQRSSCTLLQCAVASCCNAQMQAVAMRSYKQLQCAVTHAAEQTVVRGNGIDVGAVERSEHMGARSKGVHAVEQLHVAAEWKLIAAVAAPAVTPAAPAPG